MTSHKHYIAHRGNLNGPNPDLENRPDYILKAIAAGFDVEIDVWFIYGDWWLGHDEPSYAVDKEFLLNSHLWIHAKHPQALSALIDLQKWTPRYSHLNFFSHNKDEAVLTSGGYVWTYPTKIPSMSSRTIIVMPENDYVEHQYLNRAAGICSDHIANIHRYLPKLPIRDDSVEMVLKPKPADFGLPHKTWAETKPPKRKLIYTLQDTMRPHLSSHTDFSKFDGMNKDTVAERSIRIVAEQMGVLEQEINQNTHFINDLNADSLDTVELVMEFEDEFELSIPDEEAEKINTVGQAIDYVRKHATPSARYNTVVSQPF